MFDNQPTPSLVIVGRVATMDARRSVLQRGAVYVVGGRIAAVQPAAARHRQVSRTPCVLRPEARFIPA